MKRMVIAGLVLGALLLGGCKTAGNPTTDGMEGGRKIPYEPDLPDTVRVDESGVPLMDVYIVDEEKIVEMDIEDYLCGVLAGEMKNDWPMEALKAQAILARTFVIRFLSEKQSKYEGADISTDIEEAQAYNASGINDRIREAVNATRGLVVCYENEPIYAWFHSHSGGRTADAAEGLSYREEAPYTHSIDSTESDEAPPETQKWTASFSQREVLDAVRACGVQAGEEISKIECGEKGASGRIRDVLVNGVSVPANELRIALGSAEMRSTMIDGLGMRDGEVYMSGKGYGHGVGMSQWGAFQMAKKGNMAGDIIGHYFRNVDIVQKWR